MFLSFFAAVLCHAADTPAKPAPDVLIFTDGEKLIGQLISATDTGLVFVSAIGFQVQAPWTSVKELHSEKRFAAIPKNIVYRKPGDEKLVPLGSIELADKALNVSDAPAAAPKSVPLDNVYRLLQEGDFRKGMEKAGVFQNWTGNATIGIAYQSATVNNRAVNSSVTLTRNDPAQDWRTLRNRTGISFSSAYSVTTISGSGDLKTSLYHLDVAQDHFFKSRLFGFADATLDHNTGQGVDLVQAYGAGMGVTVVKTARTLFEVRSEMSFMDQNYVDPRMNRKLIGSRFLQSYTYTFKNGISFREGGGVRPAWNDQRYIYSAGGATVIIPVYKRIGVNVVAMDNFVNNTPRPLKKNIFQLSVGASYTFK